MVSIFLNIHAPIQNNLFKREKKKKRKEEKRKEEKI
jgi:hypothetical protein|tara:strand:- start:198 stop:305 length:108 start_codon:yes stop_codon:yes gene_type:complete